MVCIGLFRLGDTERYRASDFLHSIDTTFATAPLTFLNQRLAPLRLARHSRPFREKLSTQPQAQPISLRGPEYGVLKRRQRCCERRCEDQ
jgi:hypothetical protein